MSTFAFLTRLRDLDIQVSAENGKLRVNAPKGALTPDIRAELTQRKPDLIALLTESVDAVSPVPRDGDLPLSLAQEQLWRLHALQPDSAAYTMYSVSRLLGPLDVSALSVAVDQLVARHETLRTIFPADEAGQPRQVIVPARTGVLQRTEVPATKQDSAEKTLLRMATDEVRRPFDLEHGPLLRVTLVEIDSAEHALIIVAHHIILDGHSFGVLYDDLCHLYTCARDGIPPQLPPVPLHAADYAAWQRRRLDSAAGDADSRYWREQFGAEVAPLELPQDFPHPLQQTADGDIYTFRIDSDLATALNVLCRQERVTLFTVILTAFELFLRRTTGQQAFVVCSPVAGRDRADLAHLVGYLNNTVVLHTDLGTARTVRHALQQTHATVTGALAHQSYPFSRVAALPQLAQVPLSRGMVSVQASTEWTPSFPDISATQIPVVSGGVQYDLALTVAPMPDELRCALVYRSALFRPKTIAALADSLVDILSDMAAHPERVLQLVETTPPPQPAAVQSTESKYTAPRTDLERNLAAIWADLLAVEQVGIHDGFFELGGHSLLALNLFERINDRFDTNLPLATLFQATTVAQLAQVITQARDSDAWSSLVPIQPNGSRPPFFCIHGITGDVLWFRRLGALCAPDQPFYGVQAQGLDGVTPPFDSVATMAAHYIDEIKTVQPRGPYYLGGASLGGTVAFEMARQLTERGESVALLVMFDHSPAGTWSETRRLSDGWRIVQNAPRWIGGIVEVGGSQLMQRARRKARAATKQLQRRLGSGGNGVESADLLDYGAELPAYRQRLIEAHYRAFNDYFATPYTGPILLLRAYVQPLLSIYAPELGWRSLAQGPYTEITVPGSHEGMFRDPHVTELATRLQQQLQQAQARAQLGSRAVANPAPN